MPKPSFVSKKLYKLTPVVSALSLVGFFATPAQALTVIPSSNTTVNLQTLAPSETTFDMPSTSTITTTSGTGIGGDASKNWILTIEGSVTGAGNGVTLSSSTINGAQIDNYGMIRGNGTGTSGGNAGVILSNGGRVYNHAGATIASNSDAIYINIAGATVINDGTILTNVSGVYFGASGSFTQSATGVIDSNGGASHYGVVSNGGVFTGNNAGLIKAGTGLYGVWIRNAGSGSLINTGTISTASGTGAGAAVYLSVNGASTLTNSGLISGGGTTSVGILKDNSGAATIDNQAGGVISGSIGINLAAGSSTITNTGTITGTGGRAVNLNSAGNTLILGTGSILNGNAISGGANNSLIFQGSGSTNSSFVGTSSATGFNSIIMNGTSWNLGGNINLIGTSLSSMSVNTGVLVLTGTLNSVGVGGGITIASGATMQIGNGGITGDVNGSIVNNGTLSFFRSDAPLTLDNSVSGSGIIRFKGTGVASQSSYVMNGNNSSFTGDVVIENGARLQATSTNPTPLAHILVQDGGTLWLGGHANYTSPLFIQGKGWTESMGQLGALRLDSGAIAGGPVTLLDDARITAVFANYIGTISGAIGDGGHGYALEKTGTGLINLSGNNTYSGGTQINGGTIAVFNNSNLGAAGSNVSFDTGTLLLPSGPVIVRDLVMNAGGGTLSTALTSGSVFGNITGSGQLTIGNGSILLDGQITHTGGTVVNAGTTLTLGTSISDANDSYLSGNLLNNGTYQINLLGTYAYSDVLSGIGALVKNNTGTTILSGAGSSQSTVNVNAGELSFAQTGTFTTTGDFTTAANATTSVAADSTLNIGGIFTQASNANLNLALGSATPVITANSASLDGALNITGFGTSTPVSASALSSIFFNVIHTSTAGALTGDFSSVNFNGATPVDYLNVFGGKTANNQDYNVGVGLTWLAGAAKGNGSFTLTNASDTFNVDVVLADQTAPFASGWDGKTLTKAGAGTLILSTANTYTGNTLINAGELQMGIDNTLVNSANVTIASGATLDLNNFSQQINNLGGAGNINLGSAALSINSSASPTLSGIISGSGSLNKFGTGTLTISGVNTYTGGSTFSGSAIITQGSALGTGLVTINGGLLQMDFAADSTLNNQISGSSGIFTKENSGTATLTASGSNFGGSVAVNGGTLQLSQSGAFNAGNYTTNTGATTNLSANSSLVVSGVFKQSANSTLTVALGSVQPIISATSANLSGALNISGFGASAPNSASALAGTLFNIIHTNAAGGITGDFTSVNLGGASSSLDYLQLSGAKSADNQNYNVGFGLTWLAGAAKGNGTFTLTNASDAFNVDVVLADQATPFNSGWDGKTLTKNGAGTLTLSSTNTYSGNTAINAGTLKAGTQNIFANSSKVTVLSGATLDLNNFNQTINSLTDDGHIILGSATLTANNTSGSLFGGNIDGSGSLIKTGLNSLVLTGTSTYSGGTLVSNGSLHVYNGGAVGTGSITNNSLLYFNFASNDTINNLLAGTSDMRKTGAGIATLTSAGSKMGNVQLNEGGLKFTQNGDFIISSTYTAAAGTTTEFSSVSTLNTYNFTQAAGSVLTVTLGSIQPIITARNSAVLGGTLNISGFSATAPNTASALASTLFNIIHANAAGGITGDFSSVNLGGASSSLDYLQLSAGKSANSQDYNVGFGLTWLAGTAKGDGVFTLTNASDAFDVDVILADQTAPFTSGWDGKTLTKSGAGTLTLSSANTYTGNTVINAGTLRTGTQNAFINSSNVSIASGGTLDLNNFNLVANNLSGGGHIVLGSATLTVNNSNTTTFSGNIDGSGSLIKTGNNILTLTGTNTYSGGTLISYGGSIVATNGNALGSGTITNNYGLYLRFAADEILSNVLAGSGGEVNKTGAGVVTLAGTGSSTGNLTLNEGGVKFTQNGDFIVQGGYRAAAGTTTELSSASTLKVFEYNQAEGAALSITLGSIQPIIDASRAFLGGALNISGFSASAPNTASALASTQFNIIHTTAAGGGITGDFSSVNLGGASNSLDYLQLSAGKSANNLDYNVGFGLTWLAGAAKGNGVFTLTNASDAFDVDVVLADQTAPFTSSWDGKTLTKEGAGTLTLSSTNTYTGSTIINAGTLKTNAADVFATGGNVSEISIASGATLDLNGFNQQTNNLTGAGNIKLGSAALTAINYFDSTFSGSIEGSGSLIKANSGILTLSGSNTYSGGTLISGGWISATNGSAMGTGAITNNSAMELAFANDSTLANTLTGTGLLVKNKLGTATLTSAGSSIGNIDISAGSLKFAQNGAFTVSNNYLNLSGASTSMNANSTLVVGNQFQMNGALNIIAGNTQPVINAGTADLGSTSTLNISGYSAPASASASQLADNTYRIIQTAGVNHLTGQFNNVTIGGSSSPVDFLTLTGNIDPTNQNYDIGLRLTWYAAHTSSPADANGSFTLSGATDQFNMDAVLADEVANAATGWDGKSLTKAGAGTLTLSKTNLYSGTTQINGGVLQMGMDNAIALSSDVNVSGSSRLDLNSFNQDLHNLSGAGQITLGTATLSAYNYSVDSTFSGQISGSGALTKEGANKLILSGNNIYTGTTTINAGSLQLGDGGVSGSVLGDIVDNGTLIFDRSNDLVYSNIISGSGAVVKNGSNTLTLTNDHIYLGSTTVNEGVLQIGNGGTSGSIAGDVLNNAAQVFNRSDDIHYDHIVSGTGSLTKEGQGSLTLNFAQTYTGTTNVNHGTLVIGDDAHSGGFLASTQVNIASGATLGGYGGVAGNVDNQGTLAIADALAEFTNSAAGTFTVGGNLINSGNIVMASVLPASRLIVQGNYIGNNGLITLSTVLNGDTNSATDRVEILGDTSGHTNVKINNSNGAGEQTIDGIEIISVGGQSNGTFSLVGRVVAGAYDYGLIKNASDGDWYLRSFKDNGDDGPKWRPEVGAYLGNQYLASAMQVHTLYDRQSSVHSQNNGSGWVRVITRKIDSQTANGQVDQDSDYNLIQFGGDVAAFDLGESRLYLGAMGSYGSGHTDSSADGSSYKAKGDIDGYNLGLYATWFANAETQKGLYVDGWLQGGWYDNKVQGEVLNQEKYDSRTWTTSLEAGYSFELANNAKYSLLLTPQAQIVYNNYQADDHTEQNGSRISNQNGDTLMTRVGARLSGKTTLSGREIQPFFEMNWWHSNQSSSIDFKNQTVEQGIPKDRAEFKAGIQGEFNKNWSGWLNVGVQTGSGQYRSIEGLAGVKYIF